MNGGLEEPYRTRAVPPGSARYWSWLFAAQDAREPLLAMYALLAEWRALMDPGTEAGVAQVKLVWWRDEIRRLAAGSPLHPITRHIAALPGVHAAGVERLEAVIGAAGAEVGGVPLERSEELAPHADALYGLPLRVAAAFDTRRADAGGLEACTAALAAAEYLSRALADHRRELRRGRMPFAVDELLAAGIDNDDLCADHPPPRVIHYLARLRATATDQFSTAALALSPADRPQLRHLAVIARLGARRLAMPTRPSHGEFRFADLYNAWSAARSAAAAR